MANGVQFCAIMPHPPIMIPEIGGKRIKEAEKTKKALEEASKRLKSKKIDTIVIVTPHGAVGQAAVPIYTGHVFEGHFGYFGYSKPVFSFKGDAEFGLALVKEAEAAGVQASPITETFLDHGVLVPMYYPKAAGVDKPILPVAIAFLPLRDLFKFGKVLGQTAEKLGRKIAVIASADMSHRLTQDAPSGFHEKGAEFDEKLVKLVKDYDVNGILDFPDNLSEIAGQDALWSIAVLLGALDGKKVQQEVLSYEGPFGVGYMVATFDIKG